MIDEVLAKYPNDVKVVIKNFPLNFHKQARKAAKYALAADRQGKFKEMYHMIFCGTTESVPAEQCTAWRKLKQNEDLPLEYAQTLGYNYQSSEWYKESYKVFNKDYEKIIKKRKKQKNKVSTLEKIKSLLKNEK